MELADVVRCKQGCVEVDVLVSPRSSRSGLDGIDPWRKRLVLRVKAPPLDGRANKEVEELLSELTGCKVQVISGNTSRQKTLKIIGGPELICRKISENL